MEADRLLLDDGRALLRQPAAGKTQRNRRLVSNVRAYGTGRGVFTREDFWFIVVTEGNEDETEIHARQRPCREDGP